MPPAASPSSPRRSWLLRKRLWLGLMLAAFAVLWAWGLARFLQEIPSKPEDLERVADAIVVLTGGKDRIDASVQLLLRQRGEKLFITGVDNRIKDLRALDVKWPQGFDPSCCVELGYRAADTYGNAAEAAHWMQTHRYRSLWLVTAAYHMPRSLLEFREAMGEEIEILPYPVFPDHVRLAEWWLWPGTAFLVLSEYHKYWFARLGHAAISAFYGESRAN